MKIQNTTTKGLVLHDPLVDAQSQYQSGVKSITLAPNGSAGDTIDLPDTIAGESTSIQKGLADGSLKLLSGSIPKLGADAVPGVFAGSGIAVMEVIKTARDTGAAWVHTIMFGDPVVGSAVIDEVRPKFAGVAAAADVAAINLGDIVGGGMTAFATVDVPSGNVMVTFTSAAAWPLGNGDQALWIVAAKSA